MKLEMLDIVQTLDRNPKYWLRMNNNDKTDIKLNKKELDEIRELIGEGNRLFLKLLRLENKKLKLEKKEEKIKNKCIDFITKKTKRRKK